MHFGNITQSPSESIQDYIVRLKSAAMDCEFYCPTCQCDLLPLHVKDQFIRGIFNNNLQTDFLAKAGNLQTLEQLIAHAAFETALRDQLTLNDTTAPSSISCISDYCKQCQNTPTRSSRPCPGCSSHSHGTPGSNDQSTKYPAWDKNCLNCSIPNHFVKVCRKDKRNPDSANALIEHVFYDQQKDTYTSCQNNNAEEILVQLKPVQSSQHMFTTLSIFPDSGASICLAGPKHINQLGIHNNNLIPCNKQVTAVGGSKLQCSGWLPITFQLNEHRTNQPLFICDKIDQLYFSKQGCIDLKILPPTFPSPMAAPTENVSAVHATSTQSGNSTNQSDSQSMTETILPSRTTSLPYQATVKNIPKLEQFLKTQFASSVFNCGPPFPQMNTPPAHIHLKHTAVPHAHHIPVPIPHHWKQQVKASLDADVKKGIISQVPIGTPSYCSSQMIVVPKKDGSPCRTVDLQHLNSVSPETHHCPSPFQLVSQISANTFKTVLDSVDGYHAIPLDKESQTLTAFIFEWGRYMYNQMPQRLLAGGDIYADEIDMMKSSKTLNVKSSV